MFAKQIQLNLVYQLTKFMCIGYEQFRLLSILCVSLFEPLSRARKQQRAGFQVFLGKWYSLPIITIHK